MGNIHIVDNGQILVIPPLLVHEIIQNKPCTKLGNTVILLEVLLFLAVVVSLILTSTGCQFVKKITLISTEYLIKKNDSCYMNNYSFLDNVYEN